VQHHDESPHEKELLRQEKLFRITLRFKLL